LKLCEEALQIFAFQREPAKRMKEWRVWAIYSEFCPISCISLLTGVPNANDLKNACPDVRYEAHQYKFEIEISV